ncbi:MAG: hypothetical protein KatS3mg109_1546 [Pirellulaceae bacterium]|nr:MAG: hypothetical protein KatS3mg109_1546 [Pirellulaceae bacterium]GIW93281.1 MAG: hypothetical protein KatS3mg110_1322 [Pirellulaceae bacterium]
MKNPRVHYDRPPVVEVILGTQFELLSGFGNAHLGAFWKTLDQEEWPFVADAPPLLTELEEFTPEARWARGLRFQLSTTPVARLQITNRRRDRMIQVQNNCLHFNWIRQGGLDYPRYACVREGFITTLKQFVGFVNHQGLGQFRPSQWEVTYLNHIPKGTVWHTPQDWDFFSLLRSVPVYDGLIAGESFSGEWHFMIPDKRGRLHVRWEHGLKSDSEETELVVLTLTARGPLEGDQADLNMLLDGVDLGHRTVVEAFAKLMSEDANKYWGLKYDNR